MVLESPAKTHIKGPGKSWKIAFSVLYASCICFCISVADECSFYVSVIFQSFDAGDWVWEWVGHFGLLKPPTSTNSFQ